MTGFGGSGFHEKSTFGMNRVSLLNLGMKGEGRACGDRLIAWIARHRRHRKCQRKAYPWEESGKPFGILVDGTGVG